MVEKRWKDASKRDVTEAGLMSGVTPKSIFLIFKHRDVIFLLNEYNTVHNKKKKSITEMYKSYDPR